MPRGPAERRYRRTALNSGHGGMSRATRIRSNKPHRLVLWVLTRTFLHALLVVLSSVVSLASFVATSGAGHSQTAKFLPFLAAALAAIVTGVLVKWGVHGP